MLKNFWKNEEGQGMVEYGLIIALIAVVVIAALGSLSGSISGIFNKAANTLKNPNEAAGLNADGTPKTPEGE